MNDNREPVTPTVKISIKGGIATVDRKDIGIRLIIVDRDGEQVGEGCKTETYSSTETYRSSEQVGRKPAGRKYTRFVDIG